MHLTQGLKRAALIRPRAMSTKDGSRQQTWAATLDRVACLAAALRAHGLARGDRVAILSLNSDRYFEALFAVPWAGGAAVPVNTRLAPQEIDFILSDSGAKILIIDETFAPLLPKLAAAGALTAIIGFDATNDSGALLSYEELIAGNEPAGDAMCGGDDLAGIYYTGGTTGKAKGVMLSHTNLVANALNVSIALGYDRDSVYLHAPPMFHLADGCSTFGVTMLGGSHVFMPRYDPARFLAHVATDGITDVTLVPTMINMFLNDPGFADTDFSSMKRIYFGAAPMPDGLLRSAIEKLPGVKFQQAWGMTELSPIAATMEARFTVLDGPDAGRLASCGQPVATVDIRIVGEDGKEVPRGTVGEIAVRGPTVMQGYWNQPEVTAEVLRGGWMHSGDAAYMDEDGFVYIVDRLKDMIVSGGENVYSAEVENAISTMPGVAEVAVIGIPHETWGEAVHAVIVPRAGEEITLEIVAAHCREHIAGYKCPRSMELRNEPLPLSAAGKVLKTALRAPHWRVRDKAGAS